MHFQPGEGSNRALLCDYEPSCEPSFQALDCTHARCSSLVLTSRTVLTLTHRILVVTSTPCRYSSSGLVSWDGGMCCLWCWVALVVVDVKYFNMDFILLAINCNFYCWFFKIVHVYFMIMQP